MEINREYRSSVFAMLFNDRKELLTLYNAINGTAYTEEDRVISELPFYGSSQTEDKVSRGIRLGILRLISKSGYSERNISLIFWSSRANLSNPP